MSFKMYPNGYIKDFHFAIGFVRRQIAYEPYWYESIGTTTKTVNDNKVFASKHLSYIVDQKWLARLEFI